MTAIMSSQGQARFAQKHASRERILRSAAAQFRRLGVGGASVASIMQDAGLTHGGFYAHFDDKLDLLNQAFAHAMDTSRAHWTRNLHRSKPAKALHTMISRYLSREHCDHPSTGCPLPSLAAQMSLHHADTADTVEACIRRSMEEVGERVEGLADVDTRKEADDLSVGLLALCAGGVVLARAVESRELSDQILRACRRMARAQIEAANSASPTRDP